MKDPCAVTEEDLPLRYALEARHESFDTDAAAELLRARDVALAISDGAGQFPLVRRSTASFAYVRLHGAEELYASGYDAPALDAWAGEVRAHLDAGRDTYVYFDDDARGRAPWDAVALRERLGDYR